MISNYFTLRLDIVYFGTYCVPMLSVVIDDRPSKKCRMNRSLGMLNIAQSESASLEVDHPPQIIELVIDSGSSDSDSESDASSENIDNFWVSELTPAE